MKQVTFITILIASATQVVADEHWNQFRGANGDGIANATDLPVEFDEAKNIRWKTAIPGEGWSSPVVWEDEVWLTSGDLKKRELRAICVDLNTGKIIKNIKVFDMIERKVDPAYKHDSPHLNSVATPTSVVEDDRVYVSFGSQGIACLDRKTGDKVWKRRYLRRCQPVRQGSSPIVDDKKLYVAYDGTDQQFFVALDKKTGDTVWKQDRNVNTDWAQTLAKSGLKPKKGGGKPGDNKKSFATATIIEVNGKQQLIAPAAEATIAYDPENGKELWRVVLPGGFNVAARPLYANGLVYVFTSGLTRHLAAIKPDGQGDVTDSHVAWSNRRGPSIPSPIIREGMMFAVSDKGGIVRCLNAKTGEEIWKSRISGNHWASPIYANGRLYFSSKSGEVAVINAAVEGPGEPKKSRLRAEFIASPAVAGSSLLLRSTSHLYCVANGHSRTEQQVAADVYPDNSYAAKLKGDGKGGGKGQSNGDARSMALKMKLGELVKSGKLTLEEATELYNAANGKN